MKLRKVLVLLRDLAPLVLGIFGVLHQEITGRVNLDLLGLYTLLLGTPGAIAVVHLVRGNEGQSDTPSSSPAPPPSPSVEPSASPWSRP